MGGALIIGLLALGAVLWWLLDRHEARRAGAGGPRNGGLRLAIAAAGLLLMLFSGGCSLLFIGDMLTRTGGERYVTWEAVAVIGGIPLAVGLLVFWLAIRHRRP